MAKPTTSEYETCPHCGGLTKCDCGTCGIQIPTYNGVRIMKGVCKVCQGRWKSVKNRLFTEFGAGSIFFNKGNTLNSLPLDGGGRGWG